MSDDHGRSSSTRIRSITDRRSLLSTSSTRPAVAWPGGSVSASCGAGRGYSVSHSYRIVNELGSSFPPAAIAVCRADLVASRTGRIPFWVKRGLSGTGLQHLPLVSIDEVYQNFTCVCHIVPA